MKPGIYHQTISHDDNCSTPFTRNMKDCTCKELEIKVEKSKNIKDTESFVKRAIEDFKQYRQRFN